MGHAQKTWKKKKSKESHFEPNESKRNNDTLFTTASIW
jgi:hypothetical protein